VSLLKFYTLLLRRWTVAIEVSGHLDSLPWASIPELIQHANRLALTLTQTSSTVSTYLAILDFFAATSRLYSNPEILKHLEITIPPAILVYILFFSPSLAVMSRLCGVVVAYKRALEVIMSPRFPRELSQHEKPQVNVFNGFLMDLCNCLWRGRAFSTTDLNAQGCRIPQSIQPALQSYLRAADPDLSLSTAFDLSHSPLLCLQSISSVRRLEEVELDVIRSRHAGPVTQSSLNQLTHRGGLNLSWQEYRAGVLDYLESQGFSGVSQLMHNTMRNLMKAKR
jgi:centromere protein I